MNVGTLEIQMLANMARLAQDMESAKRTVGNAMGNIEKVVGQAKAALGALGIGLSVDYFVNFIKGGVDAMDHMNDLTKSTKLTVETLSGLKLLANQSGSDLDSLAESIDKLSVNMGKDAEKFARLGVTAKDPLEAYKQFADVFVSLEDTQLRNAVAAEALGKKWEGAAPALSEGSQRIGEMIERGKRLSGITQENAERADQFNDQLAELNTLMGAAKLRMVGDMLPAMNEVIRVIITAYEESGKLRAAWVALGALGAFAFTDEFSSAAVKIQNLRVKLEELERDREMADKMPAVGIVSRWLFGTGKNDAEIERVRREIAGLQEQMDRPAKKAAEDKSAESAAAAARAKKFLDEKAAAQSKAQLDVDVERIRAAGEARVNAFNNAEKILSARRDASKLDEQVYYEAKRSMLNLVAKAQEDAALAEIARLQRESLSGKDKLENDKKIVEAQAKLAKIRGESITDLVTLEINEEGRLREEQERARAEDIKGWVAYAEARINEDFEMTQEIAKQQIEAAEEIKRKQREVWDQIGSTAHDTFIGLWKGSRDVFTRISDMIENTLLEVLYQLTVKKWIIQIEEQVTRSGGLPGMGASNGGGIWEALGSKLGGMFSGNGGFGTGSNYGNQDYGAFFANGGDHSGGWRVVGERGPELEATGPSRIFNAQQTRDILAGDGGSVQITMPVTVTIQGNADDNVIRRSLQEMEGRIYKNVPSVVRAAQLRTRTTPNV